MKKTLYLIVCLIFTTFTTIQAQNNQGFEALENGDFVTAEKEFKALYSSKKTKLFGAHGLASLYAHEEFEGKNLIRANTYATEAKKFYDELSSKKRQKLRAEGWKYASLRDLRKNITTAAVSDAKNENTEEALTQLLQNFKLKYEDKKAAYRVRNVLVVNESRAKNTYADYNEVYKKYPRKEFTKYTPNIAAEIDLLLFESFIEENGYDNMAKFKAAQPKSPIARDSSFKPFVEACKKGTADALVEFLSAQESGRLRPVAERKYQQLKKKELIESLEDASDERVFREMQEWLKPAIDSAFWNEVAREAADFEPLFEDYPFYRNFMEVINRPSENIEPVYLKAINTQEGEYAVCIATDMNTLYFCSNGRADNLGGEDVFYSEFVDGQWTAAKLFENASTTHGNEAPQSVTTDGTRILLFQSSQIGYIDKTPSGWTEPKLFEAPLNKFSWQSDVQILPGGLGMFFAAKNGNNTDIYYSPKTPTGWGEPVNIGAPINTDSNERSPFVHFDRETMYFSSGGHGGLGETEVFMTKRLDNTWTKWSKPVNLGKNINTSGKDWDYQITSDGTRAFYSSGNDLYEVKLPERYRPDSVTVIETKVDTTNIVNKMVVIEDAETGELLGKYKPDPKTGEVIATIPADVKTTIRVEAEGVISSRKLIEADISKKVEVDEIVLNPRNELSFSDLLFDTDSDVINASFHTELDRVVDAIRSSDERITVAGHTDNQGNDEYNLSLSQRRAEAVKTYLTQRGISEYRISAIGYGESQPVDNNETEEGRSKNRRVVLKFE